MLLSQFLHECRRYGRNLGILIEPRGREETQTCVEIGQEPEFSAPGAAIRFLCSTLTLVKPRAVVKFSVAAQKHELHKDHIPFSPLTPALGLQLPIFLSILT